MPGESGQLASYLLAARIVTPQGKNIVVNGKDPELLRVVPADDERRGDLVAHREAEPVLRRRLVGGGVVVAAQFRRGPDLGGLRGGCRLLRALGLRVDGLEHELDRKSVV